MNARPKINFSPEQEMLLEVASKFAADKSPLEIVRQKIKASEAFDKAQWVLLVELGWAQLTIDEADGGSGLGIGEAVAILEPLGRQLFASPLADVILAAEIAKILRAKKLLEKISKGALVIAALNESEGAWDIDYIEAAAEVSDDGFVLSGTKTLLPYADSADYLLLLAKINGTGNFFLLQKEDFDNKLTPEKTIDETQRSFKLKLDGIKIPKEARLGALTKAGKSEIERKACLLLAAQMCGGIAGVLELVVEYLTTRKQFEKYIGSYQALKHPVVDILLGLEASRSHLYYAAGLSEKGNNEEAIIAAHMTKAKASDVFSFATDRAIQFMGAFGFTYDCDAQLFLRRSIWCEYQRGDSAYHRQKIAELVF